MVRIPHLFHTSHINGIEKDSFVLTHFLYRSIKSISAIFGHHGHNGDVQHKRNLVYRPILDIISLK